MANLAEVIAETGRALAAARDMYGPAPQDAAWTTTDLLADGHHHMTKGKAHTADWEGPAAQNYRAVNDEQTTQLGRVAAADDQTGPVLTAVGQAVASGREELDGIIRDAQADAAQPATTPAAQAALADRLRHHVRRAHAVLRASEARGAQLTAALQQGARGYRGPQGMGGGIPMGGIGGGMPLTGLTSLIRAGHHSGLGVRRSSVTHSHGTIGHPAAYSLGGSGPAKTAVTAALSRLGMPYVWGAKGDAAFDCSGLTQWAYKQAGIKIGDDTYAQINDGVPVAPGDVQAGDLIFPHAGHVQLALGDGRIIEAQQPGVPVKISPMPGSFVVRRPCPTV